MPSLTKAGGPWGPSGALAPPQSGGFPGTPDSRRHQGRPGVEGLGVRREHHSQPQTPAGPAQAQSSRRRLPPLPSPPPRRGTRSGWEEKGACLSVHLQTLPRAPERPRSSVVWAPRATERPSYLHCCFTASPGKRRPGPRAQPQTRSRGGGTLTLGSVRTDYFCVQSETCRLVPRVPKQTWERPISQRPRPLLTGRGVPRRMRRRVFGV